MTKYIVYFYRDENARDCAGFKCSNTEYGRDFIIAEYSRKMKRIQVFRFEKGVKENYPMIDKLLG